jgi:phage repressor protein C with HTH and peptisase S24 domain
VTSEPPLHESPRAALARVMREQGVDYARLSRLIGRNAAYIQQFVQRGSPRQLAERDRAVIATYLGVDESLLGGPVRAEGKPDVLASVPRLDVGAAAGVGVLAESDHAVAAIAFDRAWLRDLGVAPANAAILRVEGDSMAPTLGHGDEILVDSADAAQRLRDGIYVLRRDDALLVKRLDCAALRQGRVGIVSDNPAWPLEEANLASLTILGRVRWSGRSLP